MFFAIIAFRSGSKGIPGKNTLPLVDGISIVQHAYNKIKALNFDQNIKVIISTDDTKFAKTFCSDDDIIHERSSHNADSVSTLDDVAIEVHDFIKTSLNILDYSALWVQATSPNINTTTLESALYKFKSEKLETLFSATIFHGFVWESTSDEQFMCPTPRVNRQYQSKRFLESGAFVIYSSQNIEKYNSRFSDNGIQPFQITDFESHDLDTPNDVVLWRASKNQKIIFVICIGNPIIGMGHVFRQAAIATSLPEWVFHFWIPKGNDYAFNFFNDLNYPCHYFSDLGDLSSSSLSPDLIFIDQLDTDLDYTRYLKSILPASKLITFEDMGPGSILCDMVINDMYEAKTLSPNIRSGIKYFVMRNEIKKLALRKRSLENNTSFSSNIVVTFGGADPQNYTQMFIDTAPSLIDLFENDNFTFTIVVGPANKRQYHLNSISPNITLVRPSPSDYLTIINRSTLAITSYGRTIGEFIALSTPVIAFAQNERELTHSFANLSHGCISCGICHDSFQFSQKLFKAIESVSDPTLYTELRKRMKSIEILDGLRVTVELLKQVASQ